MLRRLLAMPLRGSGASSSVGVGGGGGGGAFTHLKNNQLPQMVHVGEKEVTARKAQARSIVKLPANISSLLDNGEIQSKKGPVFATAIIAGTMAAKKTSDLIPFCHPVALEQCDIDIKMQNSNVIIEATVSCHNKTGVEMEALVAASVASLTIYDMCKALSHDMEISETRLISKTGGKSQFFHSDTKTDE